MPEVPLDASVSATFDANGRAHASIGPSTFGTTWHVTRMATSSTSTVDTELRVYRNNPDSPGSMVANSYAGKGDTSANDDISLGFGERLHFVWTGGTVGATATGVISGTQKGR